MIQNYSKFAKFYIGWVKCTLLTLSLLLAFACNNTQQNVNTSSKQNDNVLIPVIKNEKVGYIDLNGQWVIQPQFQDAQLFNNQGLARVKQNNLWGVIDQTGKIIIPINYPSDIDITLCRNGMIQIHQENDTMPLTGLYDKTGKEIVGLNKFSFIGDFCGLYRENENPVYFYENDVTYFLSAENHLYGVIDKTGKIVVEPKFQKIDDFCKNGLALATLDNKQVFIDKTGKTVSEPEVECVTFGASDFARAKQNDKFGYLDIKTGKIVIEPKYEDVELDPFVASDLAKVKINGQYGFIDKTGKMVIEPQFAEVSKFDDRIELTRVMMKNCKYGFIDKTGKMVIQPVYEEASNFGTDNLARVKTTTGEWKTIDTKGQIVKSKEEELTSQYGEAELVPETDNVFLTRKEVGEGENLHDEFGILKDGKHTVLKDVDEIGNLMYPYY